ncbi:MULTISPECIES: hypothetical protein [Shinella]|jgi:hypothetical protein|uniref:Uncharacterized protein n=1 Tax=Shinella lacus TaxID=2654216 RepID=A0ABT1RAP5_9HYPH|nr:hypothetical protein [Shinella lacus]MCQ4632126.1 hypothetical protein [Shinella lacus]
MQATDHAARIFFVAHPFALIMHEKRPSRRLPHDCHMIIVRQFLTTEYGQSM